MEESKERTEELTEEQKREEKKKKNAEIREKLKHEQEEMIRKANEAQKVIGQGKGRLELETPILAGDEEITELIYDFTVLTGMDYVSAMDSDMNAQQAFRITYRQALTLFAVSVEREMGKLDRHDILERMGMTDAIAASQLATIFFSASTRAGRMRISKK